MISFPNLKNANLMGKNLMAHLRSNLTIRIPRASLPAGLPSAPNAPSYIGLQGHFGSRVAFRNIRFKQLP